MKKVVLLAGALAAGMAIAPQAASAAAPMTPNVQEFKADQYKDVNDAYLSISSLLVTDRANIAEIRKSINDGNTTFQSANGKQDALDLLEALDHLFEQAQGKLDTSKGEATVQDFLDAIADAYIKYPSELDLKAMVEHLDAEDKAYEDWTKKYEACDEYADLFANKVQYEEVDEMTDVKGLATQLWDASTGKVGEFKKLIDDAHAKRIGQDATDPAKMCTESCIEKKNEIENAYKVISNTDAANPGLVQQLQKLVKDYIDYKTKNLEVQQNRFNAYTAWYATHNGTEIKAADGSVSPQAVAELSSAFVVVKQAAVDAANFIFAFGAPKTVFDVTDPNSPVTIWGVPNPTTSPFDTYMGAHVGENDGTHTDYAGYKNQVDALIKALNTAIDTYETIYHNAQLNRDAYDKACAALVDLKLSDKDKNYGTKTPGTSDVYDVLRDAAGQPILDAKGQPIQHPLAGKNYYEATAYDTEVPAARTDANNAKGQAKLNLDQQFGLFQLVLKNNDKSKHHYQEVPEGAVTKIVDNAPTHTGNTGSVADCVKVVDDALAAFKATTVYTTADTKVTTYNNLVDNANANEAAHDQLTAKYLDMKQEYDNLTNDLATNGVYDEVNTLDSVTEFYPNNVDEGVKRYDAADTADKKKCLTDATNALNAAYSKIETAYKATNVAEQCHKILASEIANDGKLANGGKLKALRDAIDYAIDNEKAYLEGLKKIKDEEAESKKLSKEYYDHPEVYADWRGEIDKVLKKYNDLRDELKEAYDVKGKARDYVKNAKFQSDLDAIDTDLANLIKRINENKRAYDQNNALVDQALHDLAVVKADYDTKKFVTEENKTGEPTALKADLDAAWEAMYPDVVKTVREKIGAESVTGVLTDFTFPAAASSFDHDIALILSKIDSENGVDFNAAHFTANDWYTWNKKAAEYIKNEVIPAVAQKFAELVKDNEDYHKAQYDAYAALEKNYDCYNTTGLKAAVNGIATPDYALNADDHGTADATVATALKTYKDQIDNSYIAGSAKADQANIDGKKTAYVDALNHAKANDNTFMTEYGKYTTELAKVKYDVKNWQNNYYDDKGNKCSNTANTNVTNAYNAMVTAANNYLANIKTDWYNNQAKENIADNAALLKKYSDAVAAYNKAVEDAKANDTEFGNELKALDKLIPLTAYNGKVAKTSADANLKELLKDLEELEPKCNAAKYNAVLADMVSDWEKEDLIKAAVASANNTAISDYKANAAKYNALMAEVNKCATYQAALTAAKAQIEALPVVKDQLAIDGVDKKWDKDRDALINDKTGLQWIQNAIETLEKGIDTAYHNGTKYPTNAQIATDIENLKKKATAENAEYVKNENAFEPLHDNINNVIAYAEDTAHIANPAKEAFEKAVAGYVETLGELVDQLETAYLNEEAAKVKAEIEKKLADLKKKIEDCKKLAEKLGNTLGDVTKDGEFDEWDSTGSNPDGIVETVLYNRPYNERGDMDLNGRNDVEDITILNDLLWYQSVYGAKKKVNADVEFEGSIDLMVAGNTVGLALNNNTAVTGIQFDVTVPEGSSLSSVIGTSRVDGLSVMSAMIDDNTYRVLVVSLGASKVINGNDGNIVSFNVSGFGEVEVSNVIVAANASIELNGASVSLGQTTGIDEVESSYDTEIFGLDGIRQSVMKTGVNIVRGANGLVKKILNK